MCLQDHTHTEKKSGALHEANWGEWVEKAKCKQNTHTYCSHSASNLIGMIYTHSYVLLQVDTREKVITSQRESAQSLPSSKLNGKLRKDAIICVYTPRPCWAYYDRIRYYPTWLTLGYIVYSFLISSIIYSAVASNITFVCYLIL